MKRKLAGAIVTLAALIPLAAAGTASADGPSARPFCSAGHAAVQLFGIGQPVTVQFTSTLYAGTGTGSPPATGPFVVIGPNIGYGTVMSEHVTWSGGTLDVPAQAFNCMPAPPVHATLTSCSLTMSWAEIPDPVVPLDWYNHTDGTHLFTSTVWPPGAGSQTIPLPHVWPNGTVVTVSGTYPTSWPVGLTTGTFSSTAQLFCAPPTPTPTPPAVAPPVSPPAPPAAPPAPTPPPAPKPPVKIKHRCVRAERIIPFFNNDPLPKRAHASSVACAGIPNVQAFVNPTKVTHGIATLHVSAPKSVSQIRVTIHGKNGTAVTWSHVFHGHTLVFPMNVADKTLFGSWLPVAPTYGPRDWIDVVLTGQVAVAAQKSHAASWT